MQTMLRVVLTMQTALLVSTATYITHLILRIVYGDNALCRRRHGIFVKMIRSTRMDCTWLKRIYLLHLWGWVKAFNMHGVAQRCISIYLIHTTIIIIIIIITTTISITTNVYSWLFIVLPLFILQWLFMYIVCFCVIYIIIIIIINKITIQLILANILHIVLRKAVRWGIGGENGLLINRPVWWSSSYSSL